MNQARTTRHQTDRNMFNRSKNNICIKKYHSLISFSLLGNFYFYFWKLRYSNKKNKKKSFNFPQLLILFLSWKISPEQNIPVHPELTDSFIIDFANAFNLRNQRFESRGELFMQPLYGFEGADSSLLTCLIDFMHVFHI